MAGRPGAVGMGRGALLSPYSKQDGFGGTVQVGWRKNNNKLEETFFNLLPSAYS